MSTHAEVDQAREHTLALVETMVTYAERVETAQVERDTELARLLAVDQGAEDRRALIADAATNPLRGQALEDLIEGAPQSTRGS